MPVPTATAEFQQALAPPAVSPQSTIFPASTMIADAEMSPAKARIEAAKRAQQEKLANRGYGELATPKADAAKSADSSALKPKTFAQLLAASVEQRESISGRLSDEEYALLEKKIRAAYPGLL